MDKLYRTHVTTDERGTFSEAVLCKDCLNTYCGPAYLVDETITEPGFSCEGCGREIQAYTPPPETSGYKVVTTPLGFIHLSDAEYQLLKDAVAWAIDDAANWAEDLHSTDEEVEIAAERVALLEALEEKL